ncbi:MAG: PCP reductase family protein [Longimicrobiales bacterium]
MTFAERQLPGDGTMAAVFVCDACGTEVAMLTNPMETQLVSSLGVKVGGRTVPEQPFEFTRTGLAEGRPDAFEEPALTPGAVRWSVEAAERLARVPSFVRGMVKRIYADWAVERGIAEITPAVMDTARADLGLEGM